ncbi:MAG: hypothetical protein IPM82_06755 [Saprospiraceae bacterium]|nr:hypothetical protein [Saprospiraceae bacterium]
MVDMLAGGNLRSIGKVEQLLSLIKSQDDFDELFQLLSSPVRIVAMRAADAIEKIILPHPAFLEMHKTEILRLLNLAQHIEFKWHLALLASRIPLNVEELRSVWIKTENLGNGYFRKQNRAGERFAGHDGIESGKQYLAGRT